MITNIHRSGKDSRYMVEVDNPTINVPNLVRALVDSEAKVYAVRHPNQRP
jgi:hypothetical protein